MSLSDEVKLKTHFGYQEVSEEEKSSLVHSVFSSVAEKYDLMNDVMSLGVHRYWKRRAIESAEIAEDQVILDLASGTADLSCLISKKLKNTGFLCVTDINEDMLVLGRKKLIDANYIKNTHFSVVDAEQIPFEENHFDRIFIAFGLRNVTHIHKALHEMYRVLKPGGRLVILEFSKPVSPFFSKIYDKYSFSVIPWLGEKIVKDRESYQYLAESIRKHPDQETLKGLMLESGFDEVEYENLTGGVVAIHQGYKY